MRNLVLIVLILQTFTSLSQKNNIPDKKINLLVVTGGPTLNHHINLVPTSFYSLFEGYKNLEWDHASHDEAAFQSDKLQEYDAVLMYNRSDSLSLESQQNLKAYLKSGKGLIVLHHALGSYNNWEWWWKEVVGGKYQMKDTAEINKSDYKQGEEIDMVVENNHFISETLGNFKFVDETYKNLWISPKVDIIYKTSNPNSDGPTAWISAFNESKVIVIQPGHAESAHKDINYKNLIHRAVQWVSR